MDQATFKLSRKLRDKKLAEKLAGAGLTTPGAIRRASEKDLLAVTGVKAEDVANIRHKIG